jgi:hypothetical protein
MTTALPLTHYGARWGVRLASGKACARLPPVRGHDPYAKPRQRKRRFQAQLTDGAQPVAALL